MNVSIIIPARNAAATIAETLDSVLAQTFSRWEALVVDDGSTDDTPNIVAQYAARDSRLKLLAQHHKGVSAARNFGLEHAVMDWVLFLDADDWILPAHLASLTRALKRDRVAKAAYCGWVRRAPDGTLSIPNLFSLAGDLFHELAGSDLFPVHAVLVERDLVQQVGAWDETLITCEDWDLWQRVARAGGRFTGISDALALYRMRPDSASLNVDRMLNDGLEVIQRGHRADPRVKNPVTKYAQGAQDGLQAYRLVLHVFWCACYAIGQLRDPLPLLAALPESSLHWPETNAFADAVFEGVPIGGSCSTSDWPTVWKQAEKQIYRLLIEIEIRSGVLGCAEQIRRRLLQLIARNLRQRVSVFGDTLAVRIDTNNIPEQIPVPPGVVGMVCLVERHGEPVGSIHSVPDEDDVCRLRSKIRGDILRWIKWRVLHRRRREMEPVERWKPAQVLGKLAQIVLLMRTATVFWAVCKRPLARRILPSFLLPEEMEGLAPEFFEYLFASTIDPWQYANEYERSKYERTLSLVPGHSFDSALEIGCAEGLFTLDLAARAKNVTAVDASKTAILRARSRCKAAGIDNVDFKELDAFTSLPDQRFDLVVCSEILYYLGSVRRLEKFANRLTEAIAPGGFLLAAHAHTTSDDSDQTGFEWGTFGAKTISTVLQSSGKLQLRSEIVNSLYRIQLYQRSEISAEPNRLIEEEQLSIPPAELAVYLRWKEPHIPAPPSSGPRSRVPILMYHRVAPKGSRRLAHYRVTPELFESHLKYLSENKFHTITLAQWQRARRLGTPLPGRTVVLTFDDGYDDFQDFAWPLLRNYGFTASVFLVTGLMGGENAWDADSGESIPLLSWSSARRLVDEGVDFGSHSATHAALSEIDLSSARTEIVRSRKAMEAHLGVAPSAFAYPYGLYNWSVRQLIQEAGYDAGLACHRPMAASFDSDVFALPRLEVSGSASVKEFALKLW